MEYPINRVYGRKSRHKAEGTRRKGKAGARSQETGDSSQEPGVGSQEKGKRIKDKGQKAKTLEVGGLRSEAGTSLHQASVLERALLKPNAAKR
jgi:hypothetical protein